jgi:hypothetical protein
MSGHNLEEICNIILLGISHPMYWYACAVNENFCEK